MPFRRTSIRATKATGFYSPKRSRVAGSRRLYSDPFRADVQLLLPMNGSNGGTTFTDLSTNAFSPTVFGGAQTSTAQSYWYGSSGFFDGSGDYLSYASSAAFAFPSNFTIEAWVRPVTGSVIALYGQATGGFRLYIGASGQIGIEAGTSAYRETATGLVVSDVWQHIAVAKDGTNTYRMYLDGVERAAVATFGTMASTIPQAAAFVASYNNLGQNTFNGYMQDFRITKGTARYTANFTPPVYSFSPF